MAESAKPKARVLVVGTDHSLQRHQDTTPEQEEDRAELDQRIRQIINEWEIDLIAEEAGDDKAVSENLRRRNALDIEFDRGLGQLLKEQNEEVSDDEIAAAIEELFGKVASVGGPIPTIANTIASESVKYEDVDVYVRAKDDDPESIKKRGEAIADKILEVSGDAKRILVIVGENHRADVAERLKEAGFDVESERFPAQ